MRTIDELRVARAVTLLLLLTVGCAPDSTAPGTTGTSDNTFLDENQADEAMDSGLQCSASGVPQIDKCAEVEEPAKPAVASHDADAPREITLTGRVLGPDRKPLPSAPLSLTVFSRNLSRGNPGNVYARVAYHTWAVSDERGNFRFEGVPSGTLTLCYPWGAPETPEVLAGNWDRWKNPDEEFPIAPTERICWMQAFCMDQGETVDDVLVDLSQCTGVVEGVVRDQRGETIPNADVVPLWRYRLWNGYGSCVIHGGPLPKPTTDSEGRYRVTGLPPRDCKIMFRNTHGSSAGPVSIQSNSTTQCDGKLYVRTNLSKQGR